MTPLIAPEPTDALEVEWQFDALYLDGVAAWLRGVTVPGFRIETDVTRNLVDEYCDTADWRIYRAGYTCRIRRAGGSAELTLKALGGATANMRRRRERSQPLDPATPEISHCPEGPVGAVVALLAGSRELSRLFTVQTRRRKFILADRAGVLGEVALDDTEVPAQGIIRRVEVEVPEDAVDRALPFVERMIADCGLVPAESSKFGAGLDAAGLRAPGVPAFGATEIDREMTAGDVGLAVLRRHFVTFVANEPGTRLGDDIEALHDMRVATRRIRAACRVFADYLPGGMEHFRAEFAWVGAALGDVRDLDVQIERIPGWRAALEQPEAEALCEYEAHLVREREARRSVMLRALDEARYDALVAEFGRVLAGPAPGTPPVTAVAPRIIAREHRRIRKLGDRITPDSPAEAYHELRVATKRLRYTLEFLEPVYGKPARRVIRQAVALQDLLGLHQDADVAIENLRVTATVPGAAFGPATVLAIGAVMEQYRAQMLDLRATFPDAYLQLKSKRWSAFEDRVKRLAR